MKRKILGLVFAALPLFASTGVSIFTESKNNVEQSISSFDSKKLGFMTYKYKYPANINDNNLKDIDVRTRNILCGNPGIVRELNKGYKIVVEFLYSNGVIIRSVIDKDDCR